MFFWVLESAAKCITHLSQLPETSSYVILSYFFEVLPNPVFLSGINEQTLYSQASWRRRLDTGRAPCQACGSPHRRLQSLWRLSHVQPEVLTWKETCLFRRNVSHTQTAQGRLPCWTGCHSRSQKLGLVTATSQCCPTDHRLLGLSAVSAEGLHLAAKSAPALVSQGQGARLGEGEAVGPGPPPNPHCTQCFLLRAGTGMHCVVRSLLREKPRPLTSAAGGNQAPR